MAMLFFSHRPPPRIAPFLSVASHARKLACVVPPASGVQALAHGPLPFSGWRCDWGAVSDPSTDWRLCRAV